MRLSRCGLVLAIVLLNLWSCKTPSRQSNVASTLPSGATRIIANVPSRYLPTPPADPRVKYGLALIVIQDGVIASVIPIEENQVAALVAEQGAIPLRPDLQRPFDVLYPGMINLHNHTKQNMIPVWGEALGQFANRFEWRDYGNYTKALSFNINPWVGSKITECAAFRWSELQAMVLGTTYLQGPSDCIKGFGIHQVEDGNAYLLDSEDLRRPKISSPTDLFDPDDVIFAWRSLRPLVLDQGMTYEAAVLQRLKEICPRLLQLSPISDASSDEALTVFEDKEKLKANCDLKPGDPDKFVRFMNWQHNKVVSKRKYLASAKRPGLIFHLSEGRRNDPYNTIEFDMMRIFGMDEHHVNVVHGVGINDKGFSHMGKKKMGIVWSPLSNHLLYGETLDILAAKKNGVILALGSDWTPTGSRGVLDELKVAKAYVKQAGLTKEFSDEVLYEMVTENPARMIDHFEGAENRGDGVHDIGTIRPDAAASFVAMRFNQADPYSNFVDATSRDIDLVMVDGKAIYGEEKVVRLFNPTSPLEKLPVYSEELNSFAERVNQPGYEVLKAPTGNTSETILKFEEELAKLPALQTVSMKSSCGFEKVMVEQESQEPAVVDFRNKTTLNIDRAVDIYKLLAVNLMTQSFNRRPIPQPKKGDPNFVVKRFPAMFSCDDTGYDAWLAGYIQNDAVKNKARRRTQRDNMGLGKSPQDRAMDYGMPYDLARDY